MTLERTIENALIRESRRRGVLCVKLAPRSLRGWPDRTLLSGGRVCFVETKRPKGGRLSPQQRFWLSLLREEGFECHVCSTVAEAAEIVEEFKNET